MKFSGKMWLSFTLSLENTNLEQVTTTLKIWSEKKLSKILDSLILGAK